MTRIDEIPLSSDAGMKSQTAIAKRRTAVIR